MAHRRRLLLGLGSASSLLLLYLLCLNMESPLSSAPFRGLKVLVSHAQFHAPSFGSGAAEEASSDEDETVRLDPVRTALSTATVPPTAATTTAPEPGTNQPEPGPGPGTNQPEPGPGPGTNQPEPEPRPNQPEPGPGPGTNQPEPGPGPGPRPNQPEPGPGTRVGPGPTELAFIGDVYMSEEAPPLRDCPRSVRSLVSHSDFGSRFRPDVPVLQWSKHLSPDQYQRLKQFPGAHGWGALSYQTLVDCLSVLDSPLAGRLLDDWPERSNASRCIRCAVVGNGGILKNSNKGQEIDQHHYVFRTNGAIIKGFELDVGSRTTHYVFSTNTLRNSLRSYRGAGYSRPPQSQETRYVFLPDHDRDYLLLKAAATQSTVTTGPERNTDPAQFFGSNVTKEKLKIFHPDFIRYLRNRFLRSKTLKTKYRNIYRPSTGAVMLLSALHRCDQVSAYGFMTPDFRKYSDHYFDQSYRPVGFFINHDLRLETSLWQQLHQAGLIHLYMRRDPTPTGPDPDQPRPLPS